MTHPLNDVLLNSARANADACVRQHHNIIDLAHQLTAAIENGQQLLENDREWHRLLIGLEIDTETVFASANRMAKSLQEQRSVGRFATPENSVEILQTLLNKMSPPAPAESHVAPHRS